MSQTESQTNSKIEIISVDLPKSDKINIIQDIRITSEKVNDQIVDSNILKNDLGEFLNFDIFDHASDLLDVNMNDFSDISDCEEESNESSSENLFHSKTNIELKNISNCSTETKLNLFQITKNKFIISRKSVAKLKSLSFYLNYISNLKPAEQNFVRLSHIFNDFVTTL